MAAAAGATRKRWRRDAARGDERSATAVLPVGDREPVEGGTGKGEGRWEDRSDD